MPPRTPRTVPRSRLHRIAHRTRHAFAPAAAAGAFTLAHVLGGGTTPKASLKLVLKTSFVHQYASRATITLDDFKVSGVTKHPGHEDGDVHIGGASRSLGLAGVSEIMNWAEAPEAVTAAEQAAASGKPLTVTGVWRFWPEHAQDKLVEQKPGSPIQATGSNPPHHFEIHPVTRIADVDVTDMLHPIPDYVAKPAKDAFGEFERVPCAVYVEGDHVVLQMGAKGYNYPEFSMKLVKVTGTSGDAVRATADVYNPHGALLVANRPVVFVKGTRPEALLASDLKNKHHVLGIPRINLAMIDKIIQGHPTSVHPWKGVLPYEIVVVGVYE